MVRSKIILPVWIVFYHKVHDRTSLKDRIKMFKLHRMKWGASRRFSLLECLGVAIISYLRVVPWIKSSIHGYNVFLEKVKPMSLVANLQTKKQHK